MEEAIEETMAADWSARDRSSVWHPFTRLTRNIPMAPNIPIEGAEGSFLKAVGGRRIFDGISSWWVNLHGHNHPYLKDKIQQQLERLDHVIFAGFTHPGAIVLAERLLQLYPLDGRGGGGKLFYSDNGSTAVEVAVKMAIQYWSNLGKPRRKMLAFKQGYHGDTFGAMSVGSRSPFNSPFSSHLFETVYVDPPLVSADKNACLEQLKGILHRCGHEVAGFIFEPMVQGTAGMTVQDPEILHEMLALARTHDIIIIADEVLTGFGRTGKRWAMDYVASRPDIVSLAKGLTGGVMPLGATLCNERILDAFVNDDPYLAFDHGHSYTANPVAVAAALASLDLLERDECRQQISAIGQAHQAFKSELQSQRHLADKLVEVRQLGTILALEIREKGTGTGSGYFHGLRDRLYEYFLENDVLLRPLGNVLYVLPPYCTDRQTLNRTYELIINFLTQRVI